VDREITVRELKLDAGAETRLVWYWFVVGQRAVTGAFATKALEAAMVVTGGATDERIVVLSTPADDAARDRLARFVREHAACVTPGFQGAACGP
jgi:EpsI family protein